jgi:hypothetical protein
LGVFDIIPYARIKVALPRLLCLITDASGASEMDEETGARLLLEAGQNGGCATWVIYIAGICGMDGV